MTYQYDNCGRLIKITYTSDNKTITINYDANGNRVSVAIS